MFKKSECRFEGRLALDLPMEGRLNHQQENALNVYCKKEYIKFLVDEGIIYKKTGQVAFGSSFPAGDEGFVLRSDGLKKHKMSIQQFQANGGILLENLLNLEFHKGVKLYGIDPVAVAARSADGVETRGRKAGSKNRDKNIIAAEKATKTIRVEARKSIGLPPRGRLNDEQKDQIKKYVSEHTNV